MTHRRAEEIERDRDIAIGVGNPFERYELVGKLLDEATAAWQGFGDESAYGQLVENLMDDVTEASRAIVDAQPSASEP